MIIYNNYEAGIDEVWYTSSTIYYTKYVENSNDNKGSLYVTFKNGATYLYKEVDMPTNYLQFKHEMNSGSAGKSLNAYIKPYYAYEKVEDNVITELERRKDEFLILKDKDHTYFVSGHRDITEEEFDLCYAPALMAVSDDINSRFVIGDYYGVDIMAQNYLIDILGVSPDRITVYHMLENPRNIHPQITNVKGGFLSDEERDSAMTEASFSDIAFVRKGKETSGTAQNIIRRHLM